MNSNENTLFIILLLISILLLLSSCGGGGVREEQSEDLCSFDKECNPFLASPEIIPSEVIRTTN